MTILGIDTEDAEHYDKIAQLQDKKRRFMNDLRPGKIWNFFEDCPQDEKVDHVMRYNAKPEACYVDGRVNEILAAIEDISMNIANHLEVPWNNLVDNTLVVFKAINEHHKEEVAKKS